MKVAINFQIQEGPWGGGNRFVKSLRDYLADLGHQVVTDLRDSDIDIILIIDPRWRHPNITFTTSQILRYVLFKNHKVIVVHRINECDERKQTFFMNKKLRIANYCADHTIFIASWLRDLNIYYRRKFDNQSVILNGSDQLIFNMSRAICWDGVEPFRLVTHHWSNNLMKGFDVYEKIDRMLDDPVWSRLIQFTYIGNLPPNFYFKNATHIKPMDGVDLASELSQHHAYITASINEPGGNHQIEGGLCGLPIRYRSSGALPEYCRGFGVEFSYDNFENSLKELMKNYSQFKALMPAFPHTAQKTSCQYVELFEYLIKSRDIVLARRKLWRNPLLIFRNLLPM